MLILQVYDDLTGLVFLIFRSVDVRDDASPSGSIRPKRGYICQLELAFQNSRKGQERRRGGAGGERERWMREREREICDTKMKGEREEIDL